MKIRQNVSALNTLRHTSDHFSKVKGGIERLSSGVRVNKGADGPATLIASEKLRGNIVGLQQVYENVSSSVSLLQTAEGALNEVSDLLVKIKQLTIHAMNEATNSPDMLSADQEEIDYLLDTIDRISQNIEFGGKKLFDGSMGVNGSAVGENLEFISADAKAVNSPEKGWEVDIHQIATRAKKIGDVSIDINNVKNGLKILLKEGGKSISLNSESGDLGKEIDQIIKNFEKDPINFPKDEMSAQIRELIVYFLNQYISDDGLNLEVKLSPEDKLLVRHKSFGDSHSFSVTSSVAGILSKEPNVAQESDPGKNIEGTINGEMALGEGQFLSALKGTEAEGVTIMYDKELGFDEVPVFNDIGNKIGTKLIEQKNEDFVGNKENPKIEGFVYVSQMSREFQVGLDKKSNAAFSFLNIRTSLLGKNIQNKSNFNNLSEINVKTTQGAKDSSKIVEKVIDQISEYRGELGSFQKNMLESNLNSLKINEENITHAESTLRDSNMAAEMTNLTKDKIMLQASTAMIAQANQMPQTVLNLIQA